MLYESLVPILIDGTKDIVENGDSAGKWDHVITRMRALLMEVIDIIQVEELAKSSNCL